MAWLLRNGDVVAALDVATSRKDRRKGLLGRDGLEGAMLLDPARWIHTVGMRFAIDVAYCRRTPEGLAIMATACMPPWRIGSPHPRARCVIEAEAGAFERWGIAVGDVVEIK